jgi:D-3-phosphoglycerate dehydrogenase
MRILVFDFDSTLVRSEGLDELFARSLEGSPDRERRVTEFRAITDRGMSGELAFAESLALRLALLEANRRDCIVECVVCPRREEEKQKTGVY